MNPEELDLQWALLPQEQKLLRNKTGATRLGFAVLLKFFQQESRFPEDPSEVPPDLIRHIALHVGVSEEIWRGYRWESRVVKYHGAEIREWIGFREATVPDAEALEVRLIDELLDQEHRMNQLKDAVLERCRKLFIELPAAEQIRRLVGSAVQRHETRFCETISQKLDPATMGWLDTLLVIHPFELRRRAEPLKATLMATFLYRLTEDLTDQLVDLLVETVGKTRRLGSSLCTCSRQALSTSIRS